MFRLSVVASLATTLVDHAEAGWQWQGRTLEDRQAADECVKSGDVFSFTSKISEFPSAKVTSAESHVSVATLIDIKYSSNFKVLTNSGAKEQYVLTQCGTSAPTDAEVNALKTLETNYARKHFTVPLQKAVATSTTMLGFVAALGLEDRMVAVSPYSVAPCWQKARESCSAALADEWSNQTLMASQYAAADGIFMDCPATGCSTSNGIAFNPAADPGNLHGAEYIKVMAAFFNKEAEANKIFDAKMTQYTALSSANTATSVAWISYEPATSWNPDARYVLSRSDYKLQMVRDAGYSNVDLQALKTALPNLVEDTAVAAGTKWVLKVGDYASQQEAAEAFLGALSSVGAVIDEIYAPTPKDYGISNFYANYHLSSGSIHAFMQKVLRIDGLMSADNNLDWYESRIANPEWALEGLRRALGGDSSLRHKYFRNIAKNEVPEVLFADMCAVEMPVCGKSYPAIIVRDGMAESSSTTAAITATAGVMASTTAPSVAESSSTTARITAPTGVTASTTAPSVAESSSATAPMGVTALALLAVALAFCL
eukprot:TRINITY_DN1249_c0_g1_i2.p1 TRINITY_DN1249_c0_g1~~TRINITY_DN1249_c0_g1_i2.p1  ORF type:complete len:542 (+),score=103.57 TRINITY_DN1249_c0_g1_i2:50-1675(+)